MTSQPGDTNVGEVSERPPSPALVAVELVVCPRQLVAHWKRCGVTADWLANYFAPDFEPEIRESAKSMLSTVANELLENAVKFSEREHESIHVVVEYDGLVLRIETTNPASSASAALLKSTLDALSREPLDALFAQRIADGNVEKAPGIGLLIIRRDYGARLRVRLTPRPDGLQNVRLTVELDPPRTKAP
jgi:hypothetical protein